MIERQVKIFGRWFTWSRYTMKPTPRRRSTFKAAR